MTRALHFLLWSQLVWIGASIKISCELIRTVFVVCVLSLKTESPAVDTGRSVTCVCGALTHRPPQDTHHRTMSLTRTMYMFVDIIRWYHPTRTVLPGCGTAVCYAYTVTVILLFMMPKWPREGRSKMEGCEKSIERSESRTLATSMVAVSTRHVTKCRMFLEVFHPKVDFCWNKSARLAALQRQKSVTLKTAPLTCNGQYRAFYFNVQILLWFMYLSYTYLFVFISHVLVYMAYWLWISQYQCHVI